MEIFDIFLSYRRDCGWETAQLIYDRMKNDCYSVSFDINNLREGRFDTELLRRIDQCTDFIVILDEHVFDKTLDGSCKRDNDWLRIELAYALEKDKNIIPIMLEGFRGFPDNFPHDIKNVSKYNGLKLEKYYFDAFYNKLISNFIKSTPNAVPNRTNGLLKILADTDCRVFIDCEDKGIAHANKMMRISLFPGTYFLRFESLIDNDIFKEDTEYEITSGYERFYPVYLKSLEPILTPKDMFNKGSDFVIAHNYTMAVYWYHKAADKGYADAMYKLGLCYYKGEGVEEDYRETVYWYQKAAIIGNSDAMNNLGVCYDKGEGVEKDYSQAIKWYHKAAENGNVDAMNNLGFCYKTGKYVNLDYNQAVYWYQAAAEEGNANAMYSLGICYYEGEGAVQDYYKALYWFRKAAVKENAKAMYSIGNCYVNGYGVSQDYKQAVYWYQEAAKKGNVCAMCVLGTFYEKGNGVTQNSKLAFYWNQKAADKGNDLAMNNIGYCYYNGDGVVQDYKQAVYWYEKAVEKENVYAMNNLGYCYDYGNGVAQDYNKAVYWYKKAAQKGNAYAMYNLSICYKNGKSVEINENIANKLNVASILAKRGFKDNAIEMVKEALK